MSTVAIGAIAAAGIGAAGSAVAGSGQASASENAQQLQAQEAEQALQFQEQQYNTEQKQAAPFLATGTAATEDLQSLLNGKPGPSQTETIGGEQYSLPTGGGSTGLIAPWTSQFQAPTAAAAEATPGYQFTLEQGENALQDSAAASGGALNSGSAKGYEGYAEGVARTT